MDGRNCQGSDKYQVGRSGCARRTRAPNAMSRQQEFAWRSALERLASPAIRLHRLRNLRAKLIHEALGEGDCDNAEASRKGA